MYEDLERLNALREKGAITEDEFQKEKQRLLDALDQTTAHHTVSPKRKLWGMDERGFSAMLHISQFAGILVPFAGFILPVVMWISGKEDSEVVNQHGKVVINWMISLAIYLTICAVLVIIGIGFIGLIALAVLNVVFVIKGAIKANEGILWSYPMTIKIL